MANASSIRRRVAVFVAFGLVGARSLSGLRILGLVDELAVAAEPGEQGIGVGDGAAAGAGQKKLVVARLRAELGAQLGQRLLEGLKSLLEFPFVGEVRGLGLLCGVEIVSDKATKAADVPTAMSVFMSAVRCRMAFHAPR